MKIFLYFILGASFILIPSSSFASDMPSRLKGRILLQVESKGEAWYVNPDNKKRHYLGRPADAFQVMRELGLGISNKDFNSFNGRAPSRLSGKILIKVEDSGKAYYVNPVDLKMHYLSRPSDAFKIMRELGLGISNKDLGGIEKVVTTEEKPSEAIREDKNLGDKVKSVSRHVGVDYVWYVQNQYTKKEYVPVLAEYMKDLDVKFLRVDIFWEFVEPSNGNYDWSNTDAIVNTLPPDTDLLFTIYSSAGWAVKGLTDANGKRKTTSALPANMQDYNEFVTKLSERYKGKVKYYQIENEVYGAPNNYWNGTKEGYFNLFKTGVLAIKKADPSAKILVSSVALANFDVNDKALSTDVTARRAQDFMNYIFKNGCSYFDVADLHLYYTLDSIPDRLDWFKNSMLASNNCSKPIWVTETGGLDPRAYAKNNNDSSLQAEDLVKRFVLIFANGAERAYWLHVHNTRDDASDVVWGPMRLAEDAYVKKKKPGYYSFQILIDKIGEFTSVTKIKDGYKFTVDGKPVLVLWSDNNKNIDVSSEIKSPKVRITHIVKKVTSGYQPIYLPDEIKPSNNVLISKEPVFVELE